VIEQAALAAEQAASHGNLAFPYHRQGAFEPQIYQIRPANTA